MVLQPRPDISGLTTTDERGWPAGSFGATAGAWKGEFIRNQGQFE